MCFLVRSLYLFVEHNDLESVWEDLGVGRRINMYKRGLSYCTNLTWGVSLVFCVL